MLMQFLIVHRMIQYAIAMHDAINPRLPSPPRPLFGLSAFLIVRCVPLLLSIIFGVLIMAPNDLRVCPPVSIQALN